ncbi:virulence factor Mce family protein [Mycolicibacterium chubuense NBB4]|uniref:Virulence factor Mce family protein n=1 Tax=Mycolicibacterium chubuense (strain NBB4) TaxID=710421 RepID=I4BG33_MYCCN|nr:MCE family protein [Mycolicibacterium chubuense]AFM16240.1 virulence factor Mce family protein [Mycolicibacterium chubuense NBB4]
MTRRRLLIVAVLALTVALVGGVAVVVHKAFFGPHTLTAYFTKAIAIYPGDSVQVAGVTVGHIDAIEAEGTRTKMTLNVDRDIPIPASAQAVIVSQNLVAARYVELTPPYTPGDGPLMADGGQIPLERTAVPVEWDQVKDQLMRLATDLGPRPDAPPSISRFINSAATALDANGPKLREVIAQLSGVARVLAEGSGNIVDIIGSLQTFVTALRDSNTQIVQFQDRFATLTSVLDESRSDLDAAVTNLSSAVVEVQRFIAGSRNQTSEQVQRLANVTQNLVNHRTDLENVLHVAPNAIGNAYNIWNPDSGDVNGSFVLTNFSNPVQFICGAIGAVENATASETAKLCAQYLGPGLDLLNFNGLPFPINPFLAPSYAPDRMIYTEPKLAPGGTGPTPTAPEQPPALSAYPPATATSLPSLLLPSGPPPGPAPAPPSSPQPLLPAESPSNATPPTTPGQPG